MGSEAKRHDLPASPTDALAWEIEQLLREARAIKSSAALVGADLRVAREEGRIEAYLAVLGLL
jgi:hypothetical protein